MAKEPSKNRSIRLTDTVMNELNKIVEEDDIRSLNNLMELLIVAYKENKTTAFKNQKKSSDSIKKDINLVKKELATLLYLNETMADFLSITTINEIDTKDSLVNQSREKVKRDIEKNQVKKAFDHY
ncbi:hypothetical protein B0U03_15775 [Listeria monocytogenes]|uniref:Uncharacterized protein n=1 Tax=Carnobacterium viridans TaxID=174587 RepID=A0A1H0XHW1_9LACT|nr:MULTISPECIES: hypothetical protein [Carnobacterium]EAE9693631.1 hypothetical protein [Listeria monocytogenes]EAE9696708.1 hypothetical protein [Listeria monocytogenes]EAE9699809.1 hypothetical protein [Listeria monocytogenes]EAE9712259.1 hypothetical protein [Listeria monocytogenes]EAE9724693.1 hypothetical protein [Listeria monocytogenes]